MIQPARSASDGVSRPFACTPGWLHENRMRSLADIVKHIPANSDAGLADSVVEQSRQHFGKNTLTTLPREPLWRKFVEKFDEPIIKILLAAALLSMIVELFKINAISGGIAFGVLVSAIVAAYLAKQSRWVPTLMFVSALVLFFLGVAERHFLVEGLAVMIAVILATGVAFASEYKSDREFEVLNTRKESIQVKTLRNGDMRSIPLEEIVVGDVILLETGDEIPADGRLIKATELQVDQSLMTGESEPVRKIAKLGDDADGTDQPGCVYRGTQVVDGAAHMLVTEVGDQTALGQIARRLSRADDDEEEGARQTQADDLQGTDAAAAEIGEACRSHQQDRLRCRGADLHRPARARHPQGRGLLAQRWQGIAAGLERIARLSRDHGHHHRRRRPRRIADERDRIARLGDAEDDARQLAGAPARRLRDDRLRDRHLLRQDRHHDAKQDARRAFELGRSTLRAWFRRLASRAA